MLLWFNSVRKLVNVQVCVVNQGIGHAELFVLISVNKARITDICKTM